MWAQTYRLFGTSWLFVHGFRPYDSRHTVTTKDCRIMEYVRQYWKFPFLWKWVCPANSKLCPLTVQITICRCWGNHGDHICQGRRGIHQASHEVKIVKKIRIWHPLSFEFDLFSECVWVKEGAILILKKKPFFSIWEGSRKYVMAAL